MCQLGMTDEIRQRVEAAVASEQIGGNVLRLKPIKECLDADGAKDEEVSYEHLRSVSL